jgi:endonuclease/exonuclease/phosphatase family metal-dependent hydrolase
LLGLVGLVAASALCVMPGMASAKSKGTTLNAMSRNLYLGADLSPALNATGVNGAVDAAYTIEQQVHATKFPSVRAALIASEIQKRKPDIVGLQEGALWRTGPYNLGSVTGAPTATQLDPLGGDFLTDLVNALNSGKSGKGKKAKARYTLAITKNEFDKELPVNQGTGGISVCPAQCHNERLTMRDAILVRKKSGIKVSNATSGTYNSLLRVNIGGVLPVDVTRGWVALDIKKGGKKFHVVDTHFEAFDSGANNNTSTGQTVPKGGVRQLQAQQLVGPGGAASQPNTILIGDLNSDVPVHGDQVAPGDTLGYQAVLNGGFAEKSPAIPPFGCCIQDPNLANPSSAGVTHRVDHIMSNTKKVRFTKGGLTSTYANGLWSSDHFGLFSSLLLK